MIRIPNYSLKPLVLMFSPVAYADKFTLLPYYLFNLYCLF